MQITSLVLGMTKLSGNCSSASQLSGTSALRYRLQRSLYMLCWAEMPFFKLL